ncbi:unnamed protein product, partial [marine sediment metagenome]
MALPTIQERIAAAKAKIAVAEAQERIEAAKAKRVPPPAPKVAPPAPKVAPVEPKKVIPRFATPLPVGVDPKSKLGQILIERAPPVPPTIIKPTPEPIPSRIPERFKTENPELSYLLTHAEPKQIETLGKSIVSRKPDVIRNIEFRFAAQEAYRSLTEHEKEQYGIQFQTFKEAPVEEWKHHPGGLEYLESLSKKEQEELAMQLIESEGGIEGFKRSLTREEILEVASRHAARGGVYGGQIDEKFWREYALEQIMKTPTERRELYYGQLPPPARWYSAAFKATISTAAFPIILPQTVVKYVRGEGPLLDPLGRIQTGKPLIFPDVAAKIHKYAPPAPSGAIGIGISEAIGWATGREVGEWERAQKYPIESVFATAGEITGLLIGGKILHG